MVLNILLIKDKIIMKLAVQPGENEQKERENKLDEKWKNILTKENKNYIYFCMK